jgi:hypothetical protein
MASPDRRRASRSSALRGRPRRIAGGGKDGEAWPSSDGKRAAVEFEALRRCCRVLFGLSSDNEGHVKKKKSRLEQDEESDAYE